MGKRIGEKEKRKYKTRAPMSQEHKDKIRAAMLGRKITWGDKISKGLTGKKLGFIPKGAFKKGHLPWNTGKKYSNPKLKGRKMPDKVRKALSYANNGRENKWGNHSEKTKKKISATMQGIDIKDWDGFRYKAIQLLRHSSSYRIWRELVFSRDNFTCQKENCKYCNNKIGVYLHAHHIKSFSHYVESRFDINNGITYCAEFHYKGGLHIGIKKIVVEV